MILKDPSQTTRVGGGLRRSAGAAAGVPAGVFNLVQGDGAGVGEALSKHPGIDMISFTGSTRAGILVAKNAADTVKRVQQELGGKSLRTLSWRGRHWSGRCLGAAGGVSAEFGPELHRAHASAGSQLSST